MSHSEDFAAVLTRGLTRRDAIRGGVLGGLVLFLPWAGNKRQIPTPHGAGGLSFVPLPPSREDRVLVAGGHAAQVLLRWGDPLMPGSPAFDARRQSAAAQALQFGYNCDYVGYIPLQPGRAASQHGLLVVNHEYTIPELMFEGYDPSRPTREQVDIQLAAHGISFVEVYSDVDDRWRVNRDSGRNWRVTGLTPILMAGPAAGHPWMRTSADPTGMRVQGTLANCSACVLPWGNVLSSEENFHLYFGESRDLPRSDPRSNDFMRYGFPDRASQYGFEKVYDRFRIDREPGESYRFGYAVEVDPQDPAWTPRKRTALGRIRSEGSTATATTTGQVALYYGDDIMFEHVYKFVTRHAWRPGDRSHNRGLLDQGTLYAARFHDDGRGEWLPLVAGQGPLVAANGFPGQAEVCMNAVRAATLMGATRMDRPEDIVIHPHTGKVYIALTKNPKRGEDGLPGGVVNAANPRPANKAGHVIELEEDGGDHGGARFRWRIFLLCGDPEDPDTYYGGFPKSRVSRMACPDNMAFDLDGNLWIATDGQAELYGDHDALYVVPTEGAERGFVRRFLTGVPGCEITGPCFSPDGTTLFVSVQHPGEGGTLSDPHSLWPDGGLPSRPSVLAIRAADGRRVGTGVGTEAAQA